LLQNDILHFRNRIGKLEFTQMKNECSERGLALKGLNAFNLKNTLI